jgi:probable F420-dependent oxidoreductase
MSAYLEAMSAARIDAPAAPHCPTYVAAHGPKLQALGAARADGLVTYLMPPEHTAQARARIGDAAGLNAVAFFLAEPDAAIARRKARAALGMYVRLDYYHREWRKLGFADADFADGGSDRLIDMLVAWGDERALHDRLEAFERAGASRVIVLPLGLRTRQGADTRVLDVLAPSGGAA